MPNITLLGAGSWFTEPLCTDILFTPNVEPGELRLVDVDAQRLEIATAVVSKLVAKHNARWSVTATTNRREALPGSDYVISCIEVSGLGCVRADNDIPLKYGVSQCIGDTVGPGGLFKALRTAPAWLDVLKDCEADCPNAWVLNYTNPMSLLSLAAFRAARMVVVGLCHSVQGSSRQLAGYADVPYEELEWRCAGINHMAWFTTLRHKGADLYPRLCERIERNAELYEKDPVRFDMMRHLGAFVTESSGHFSEYVPYYRKRRELIDRYCRAGYLGQESFYADNWPRWRQEADARRRRVLAGDEPLPEPKRSTEYASYIIEARESNRPTTIHGNVLNRGLIDNLPQNGCVEVACRVDASGIHPAPYGELPPQLAALCASNMAFFELGTEAVLKRDRQAALYALMLDPLTAAVCSPAEIKQMFNELWEAQAEFLPGYQ